MISRIVLSLFVIIPAASGAAPRPNVILIVSDNHAYADLGCFGGKDVISPHLDRLAAEGVKATSFYVTSPACTPSRGSILTGRYPQRNGLYEMIRNEMVAYKHRYSPEEYAYSPEMTLGLDERELTLGNLMRAAGYSTGVVGKWDSGRARRFLPTQRGFDYFFGLAVTGIDYWTHERYGVPSMYRNNHIVREQGFSEELFTREALRYIRENHTRSFFLYLPYHAPSGSANLERSGIKPPQQYLARYPEHDPKNPRTEYLATITCMDDGIGQIMKLLHELKIDQNTLVIFFPDNGAGNGGDHGPLRVSGSQIDRLSEGGIRTCFIARWPGIIPAGTSTDEFISALDIFPTLAAISGAEVPSYLRLDGKDIMPVLRGVEKSFRREMFWQSRHSRAARIDNYKWVESPTHTGLFDLAKDLGESQDLSALEPEVTAKLKSRWESWRKEMDEAEPRGPFRDY